LRDRKRRRLRAVVDTSVLVAGISAFKSRKAVTIPSAALLRDWIDSGVFVWLVTEDILAEYKAIRVSRSAELSPDPGDDAFCDCAEQGRADLIFTLNPSDFPQERLRARVIVPGSPPAVRRRGSRPYMARRMSWWPSG
jgi:hypothetical protein